MKISAAEAGWGRRLPFHAAALFLRLMAVMSTHVLTPEGDGQTLCRPATQSELPAALAIILGTGGKPASAAHVDEFVQASVYRKIDPARMWVAVAGGHVVWAALPLVSPGRTMLLLSSAPTDAAIFHPAARLVDHLCDHFSREDVHLAQVLIEPEHMDARHFYGQRGFKEIAELIYLQGHVPRNAEPPVFAPPLRLLPYAPQSHLRFVEAISKSYRQSLDCPALSGLRDMDDVVAGHQATGDFDPNLWQLLMENEDPLGVLLLSRIPQTDAMELVYLGLAPQGRGRGLGHLLMRRAIHLVLADGRRRLSLAVDSRNVPALKLYLQMGMQRITARVAMIRDLRPVR
jgi:ribosomal protein S18 acetylase RimI-like enzyme